MIFIIEKKKHVFFHILKSVPIREKSDKYFYVQNKTENVIHDVKNKTKEKEKGKEKRTQFNSSSF